MSLRNTLVEKRLLTYDLYRENEMKRLITMLLLISCSEFVFAGAGGGHHKITTYDYHDYVNSNIQSKTFVRYQNDGAVYDEVWSFERPSPGNVVRTEITTDAGGSVYRCRVNVFEAAPESFNWTQNSVCDGNTVPPTPVSTQNYDPSVVLLTNAMVPGIAWGTAGVMHMTSVPDSYYTDKNEVLAVEDVTVPAGSYSNCLKVHKLRNYAGIYTRIEWICPDIGLVKRVHGGNRLMELTDVTFNN